MSDDIDYEDDNDVEMDLNDEIATTSGDSSQDNADVTATARDGLRQQLQSDIEAFLARGGKISEIPPNVVSDPPKKPQSNYGGQPI